MITFYANGWETKWSLLSWANYGDDGVQLTIRLGRNRWISLRTAGDRGSTWFFDGLCRRNKWGLRSMSSRDDRWSLDLGQLYIVWEDM